MEEQEGPPREGCQSRAPPLAPALAEELSEILARAVASNKGYGGGLVRIDGPDGLLFEGAWGQVSAFGGRSQPACISIQ
jgi:hypothetical protein